MTAMVKAEAAHSPDTLQLNTNDGVVSVCVYVYLRAECKKELFEY